MCRKETVNERLTRLIKYWDDVLASAEKIDDSPVKVTTANDLMAIYGLSPSQARAWLKKEPSYNRRKFTATPWKNRTDEDVTEPFS